jgi:hypothetical protein
MPIKVTCSNCGGVLHAPDDAGGKRGRCPTCGNILPIPGAAAKASVGGLPEPPAAKPGDRPKSFGDFALGPQVGPPPGSSDAGTPAARSSIGGPADSAKPDPWKEKPEPKRAADPFARKGAPLPAGDGQTTDSAVKGWKRARAGLWWVQAAVFFLMIPAVLLPGLVLAEHFAGRSLLPDDPFPALKMSMSTAIPLLVAVVPVALGLLCLVLGRFGFSGAPKRSFAGGLGLMSALAAMAVFGGIAAVLLPPIALFAGGDDVPYQFMAYDEPSGMIQRFGALAAAAGLLVGEFWFGSAVGRVGTALGDAKTAGRATRYLTLFGLVVAGLVVAATVLPTAFAFGKSANGYAAEAHQTVVSNWMRHVSPFLADTLKEHVAVVKPALLLLLGLLLGLMNFRMVGAARRAMRAWLDRNAA